METKEMSQDGPGVAHDGVVAEGAGIPSVDEVYDMFERGEFDAPNPLAVAGEAEPVEAEELPLVAESDVTRWEEDVLQSVRAAGKKATWRGRRGMRERTFADREKPDSIGRYAGKCTVTSQLLEREYGAPDPQALLA